jgi:myosin heavy subunit
MEAVQTVEHPTFETVMAILDRVSQKQEALVESQKETARQMQETDRKMQETDRKMQETDRQMQETDRRMQETDRKIGRLGLRMGEVVEFLVAPNLREKFTEFGLVFPKVNLGSYVNDRVNNISLEIDVMLENGDKAMLVEAKTKPSTEDVREHIKRLEKMRKYADLHGDKRTFLGAVAGVVVTDNVKKYALKQGFFVIEPSGENFNIIPPNNKPKEW